MTLSALTARGMSEQAAEPGFAAGVAPTFGLAIGAVALAAE